MSQKVFGCEFLLACTGASLIPHHRMFTNPTPGSEVTMTPTHRKRRTLPTSEVAGAVMKSSAVPISLTDANDSLEMLTDLCPFFLKPLNLDGDEWLEMPKATVEAAGPPPSPGRAAKDSEDGSNEDRSRGQSLRSRELDGSPVRTRRILRRMGDRR